MQLFVIEFALFNFEMELFGLKLNFSQTFSFDDLLKLLKNGFNVFFFFKFQLSFIFSLCHQGRQIEHRFVELVLFKLQFFSQLKLQMCLKN